MSHIVQILEGVMDVNLPPNPRALQVFLDNEDDIVFFTESSSSQSTSQAKSNLSWASSQSEITASAESSKVWRLRNEHVFEHFTRRVNTYNVINKYAALVHKNMKPRLERAASLSANIALCIFIRILSLIYVHVIPYASSLYVGCGSNLCPENL